MPLSPSVPVNPRAVPAKRDNDLKPTTGTVVTKTAFTQIVHSADAQANLRVKRACEAKNLAQQLFRISSAEAGHYQKISKTSDENNELSNQWRKVFRQAEKLMTSIPLTVENK